MIARSIFIDADIVLTSSSGWAHGFRTNGRKLVYCHSPARWLYQSDRYLGDHGNAVARMGLRATSSYLKAWDRGAALDSDRTSRSPPRSSGGSPTRTASMPTSCSRPWR